MATRRKIEIVFAGDTANLEKAVGKTKSLTGKLGGVGKSFDGIGKGIASVAGGLGVAAGVGAAFDFMGSSIRDAADEQEAVAKLGKVMENVGIPAKARDSVEDWITKTQNATGVLDDELRPAMSKLLSAGVPLAKAQELIASGLDISAAKGKPIGTVVEALAKGYNGQTGALGKLTGVTKDAQGKALTFEQQMKRVSSTMGGAAAAAANTSAGRMKILQGRFADLKEDIGAKLLPIFNKLIGFLMDKVIPGFERLMAWVSTNWPKVRDTIVNTVQQIWQKIAPIWAGIRAYIEGVIQVIRGIINVVMGLIRGDWSRVWDGIKGIVGGVWNGIKGYVSAGMAYVRLIIETAGGVIQGAWEGIWNGVADTMSSIWGGIVGAIEGFINTIIDGINWLIEKLNSALSFDVPDVWGVPHRGEHFGLNIPTVSHVNLADGGFVSARPGGTVATLAEAGLDEAVLRVKKGTIVGRSNGGGEAVHVHVHNHGTFIGDEQKFARYMGDVIVRQKRTRGPLAAALGA